MSDSDSSTDEEQPEEQHHPWEELSCDPKDMVAVEGSDSVLRSLRKVGPNMLLGVYGILKDGGDPGGNFIRYFVLRELKVLGDAAIYCDYEDDIAIVTSQDDTPPQDFHEAHWQKYTAMVSGGERIPGQTLEQTHARMHKRGYPVPLLMTSVSSRRRM